MVLSGCTRAGVCMIQSVFSNKSMEEVTESCKGQGLRWMQLQPLLSESCLVEDIIKRAESLGYSGIVITCDEPNFPVRYSTMKESKIKNDVIRNPEVFGNFSKETNDRIFSSESNFHSEIKKKMFEPISWDWVDWVRSITTLPIILKGILNPHDAEEALKHDIQAIYVSNHGGRVLDSVPPTLYALPEIIKAVNGKVEVYVDGGIRHGTDVLKALALGARAVFVGRPIIWGLACNGEDGVFDALQMLGDELRAVMASTGCKRTSEVTPDVIRLASNYHS
ncbi:PREDICTED: hydroxyacid oxidase 1-like [Amphimedon queenslandica]|uniref:FMN hydroxy acid dehydrogenase domain-containing protein n=2 Tax=Amphimedon queenslandica TaxID=400682 RepID=A0AAN0IK77_AMPQE|nr:PREDICTED: hydroxyacid oxidase 1-like [Amphimedon queenslandica]|eukprot:XP_003391801.3 PREDICTED: hydroxyacid oxidase 1-like [Amphimedon queenslandica]